MTSIDVPLLFRQKSAAASFAGFSAWLQAHRGAATMAGLLAFAVPVTFFSGAMSAMRGAAAFDVAMLALWFLLYGFALWFFLLLTGYVVQHVRPVARYARLTAPLIGACIAAAGADLATAGRARRLIELGVVQSVQTMHLYAFVAAFVMALLFFAHLQRSREQQAAAARLASAQAGQLDARRRLARARLQAVQARIDPRLLFDMLDAVRRAYEEHPSRAERLLDELVLFLRTALPRLRSVTSTVPREAELARSYTRLCALAGASGLGMTLDISAEARHAVFPPGVLLPLLGDALRTGTGLCRLTAARSGDACRLVLTLPSCPSLAELERVRTLLIDLQGSAAQVKPAEDSRMAVITVEVPFEHA
jgi:hypothetical protein